MLQKSPRQQAKERTEKQVPRLRRLPCGLLTAAL